MRNFADKNIAVCFLHPALGFLTTGHPQTVDELTIEFQMKTIYEMTEDTFDGKLNWKSNVPGYKNAILDIKYNIASEPTAFISLDRNGKKDFIRTKLSFQPIVSTKNDFQ